MRAGSSKEINQIGVRGRGPGGARLTCAAASILALTLNFFAGCSRGGSLGDRADASGGDGPDTTQDAALPDLVGVDLAGAADLRSPADLAASIDMTGPRDMAAPRDMTSGPITGGPCMSVPAGATALRVRWTDGGGRATVNYEVHGLPDKSRWKVGAYGYIIGYTPQFVDPFLGSGGLLLDGSSFVDIEISTIGVSRISGIALSLYGRSFSTGSSGSFNWMTFTGGAATPLNYVSNVTPYRWYAGDATPDIDPNDGRVLIRIKAGGSSGSLVVNRIELCMEAS